MLFPSAENFQWRRLARPLPVLFGLLIYLIPLPVFSAPASLQKVVLQLKWFHQFQFAGYYAAVEKGYYREQGLDVELRERDPDQSVIDQVASGEADYGIGDSSTLISYLNGKPLVALAAILQHDPLVLLARSSSAIVSPYELKGKRIMFDRKGGDEAPVVALLAQTGLTPQDYQHVPSSFNNDDLIKGRVDAMSAYLTDQPFYFQQHGVDVNIINPISFGIDFYGDILFTSRQQMSLHPDQVEAMRRASLKGWKYALDHPQEIIQYIRQHYPNRLSREHMRFEAREIRQLITPGMVELGNIDINRLKHVAQIYHQLDLAPQASESRLVNFIYHPPGLGLSAAEKRWLKRHPVIRVGIDRNFAPFEWLDENNRFQGVSADFLAVLQSKLGVRFEVQKGLSWQQTLQRAQAGELDMLSDANITPQRSKYLDFTDDFLTTPIVIISDIKKGYIGSLVQLRGKKVAMEKGYFMMDLLRRDYPDIKLLGMENEVAALHSVDRGEADAYVGDGVTLNYFIQQEDLLNLRYAGSTEYVSHHRMAVIKQLPELLSILKKALADISPAQRAAIKSRWMGVTIQQGITPRVFIEYLLQALLLLAVFAFYLLKYRRLEQARARSVQQLESIVNNIDVFVYLKGADRKYIFANQLVCDLWNTTLDKIVGSDDSCWFDDETARRIRAVDDQVLLHGKTMHRQDTGQMAGINDSSRYMTTKVPLRNPNGDIYALLGVSTDVTAMHQAQQKVMQSEQLLRSSIEVLDEAFAIFDPQDRLVLFNDKYRQMYSDSKGLIEVGASFEEILKYGCAHGYYVDAIGDEQHWIENRLKIHRQQKSEMLQPMSDGRWLNVREHKTRSGYIVGYRLDVTEFYLAMQNADQANQAKSRFLACMSHEIRTPMNGILGMVQLMEDTKLDEEQQEYLKVIQQSGNNLLHIINNILDYSKLESSKMLVEKIDFDMRQLCQDSLDTIASLARKKGLQVQFDYAPDCPQIFIGDPVKIRQILINLLGNAIKFTTRGFIRLQVEQCAQQGDAVTLCLSIEDSGIGMDPSVIESLFDEFTQADQATTRKYGGTGLGLAITKKQLELMGGRIDVDSEPGKGSRFQVELTLPLSDLATGDRGHGSASA